MEYQNMYFISNSLGEVTSYDVADIPQNSNNIKLNFCGNFTASATVKLAITQANGATLPTRAVPKSLSTYTVGGVTYDVYSYRMVQDDTKICPSTTGTLTISFTVEDDGDEIVTTQDIALTIVKTTSASVTNTPADTIDAIMVQQNQNTTKILELMADITQIDVEFDLKVDKTQKIAGVDLQDNITDAELKAALDIDNVDNTSDANKPVSTAQATALGLKVDKTTEIAGKAIGTGISKADLLTALNVADGAEVNVNPDWNAVSGDAQILNKPTTISGYGITDAYTKAEVDTKMSVVYRYKGSKTTYEELPTTGQEVGDTYNIVNAHTTAPVFGAGSNLTWSGTGWDILSGDLAHKTDKVLAATEDNFVAFDGGGNIKDSGKKATDFLLTTDISAWAKAANKPSYNSGEITYDKTASGMSATDVKAAIDELNSDKLNKADKYTAPIELDYNSTNNYWDWDYSGGDNALIEMSGSEPTTDINIINVTEGDIGVVTVKGGQLTLPENSILSSDFGYLAAIGNQYYRYTFYFDGTNFEWHRSVIGDE
jgi:hypothetical protein